VSKKDKVAEVLRQLLQIDHEKLQQRYLVHYESKMGPRFSSDTWSAPWQAQDDARNFEADGYRARVMRVTVADDGRPVAEWMDWPDHGLYRVFWKSGGSSLASIGVTSDGGRWLAPINWVKPSDDFIEWDRIDRLERIHVDPE
jgi:hypothetical protein